MKTCKNASKYRGILKPRCNGGKPCETCKEKYRSGPIRRGQVVEDTWFTYEWGQGTVKRVLKTRIIIDFTIIGTRTFDLEHASQFLRKVI